MSRQRAQRFFIGCSGSKTRASQEKPAPPVIEFLGAWGTKGSGPGTLDDPRSIATDDFAAVYIADLGKPDRFVNKFTRGGHPLQSFSPTVKFQDPCASAVDHSGMIYVLDCSSKRPALTFSSSPGHDSQRSMRTVPAKQKAGQLSPWLMTEPSMSHRASAAVTVFNPRGGRIGPLGKSLKEGLVIADRVVAAPDNTIYSVRCAQPFVETSLPVTASTVNQWVQKQLSLSGAADNDTCFLAATQKYIALLANVPSAPVPHLHFRGR